MQTEPTTIDDRLLDTRQVAKFLGVNKSWVERARVEGSGPPFFRLDGKVIRYREKDLTAWVDSQE